MEQVRQLAPSGGVQKTVGGGSFMSFSVLFLFFFLLFGFEEGR